MHTYCSKEGDSMEGMEGDRCHKDGWKDRNRRVGYFVKELFPFDVGKEGGKAHRERIGKRWPLWLNPPLPTPPSCPRTRNDDEQ